MPNKAIVYDVFVASPSDVQVERETVDRIARELNSVWGKHFKTQLNVIRWETHAAPGIADDSQDVINKQLPSTFDIFIGILWGRVGTPTGRALSGTLEEFQRAYSQWQKNQDSIKLFMYFKKAPLEVDNIDPEQLGAVKSFRADLEKLGCLYWSFADTEEFANLLRRHLTTVLQDCGDDPPKPVDEKISPGNAAKDDSGLLDLVEEWVDNLGIASAILDKFKSHIDEMGNAASTAPAQLTEVDQSTPGATKRTRGIIDSVAAKIEALAIVLEAELPAFERAFGAALGAMDRAVRLSIDFGETGKAQIKALEPQLSSLSRNISGAMESMLFLRRQLAEAPRITTKLNIAIRRACGALDKLVRLLDAESNQIKASVQLVQSISVMP